MTTNVLCTAISPTLSPFLLVHLQVWKFGQRDAGGLSFSGGAHDTIHSQDVQENTLRSTDTSFK